MTSTEARAELLNIAAELLHHPALPPTFIEDWKLPKSTTRKVCRTIIEAADRTDAQCKRWALRLRAIYYAIKP